MDANAQYIWEYFTEKIGNEYGVAGLMGNLQAESGFHPDRVQGDIPYSEYSVNYTYQVDTGAISKNDFLYNGPNGGGYGLAQWTFWSRKKALYELWQSGGYSSIGSIELACDYLWIELQNDFPSVLNVLISAPDIRTASDAVLHDFESPADQSVSVEELRESMGQEIYNTYHSGTVDPDPDPEPDPDPDEWNPLDLENNKTCLLSAVLWAGLIAGDNSHGYDQENRWEPDFDCSSLVIYCLEKAGIPAKTRGATYTGNMVDVLCELGFEEIAYSDSEPLKTGDVLWRTGHTAFYYGGGEIIHAAINELGTVTGGETGDQTGEEICFAPISAGGDWEWIIRLPSNIPFEGEEPDLPTPTKPNRKLSKLLLFAAATDRY